jgi:hypothetical protein
MFCWPPRTLRLPELHVQLPVYVILMSPCFVLCSDDSCCIIDCLPCASMMIYVFLNKTGQFFRLTHESPVVTICAAQWSLYVPPSGHYMCRPVVTICAAQWSLYVPHSGHYVPPSGHYMYRTVVTICAAQWSLYVPHSGNYMYRQFNIQQILHFAHKAVFMCFMWILGQTAIISLYNIN